MAILSRRSGPSFSASTSPCFSSSAPFSVSSVRPKYAPSPKTFRRGQIKAKIFASFFRRLVGILIGSKAKGMSSAAANEGNMKMSQGSPSRIIHSRLSFDEATYSMEFSVSSNMPSTSATPASTDTVQSRAVSFDARLLV